MVSRPLWESRLAQAWTGASLVWLTGVRRVGKTTLIRALPGATYLNCDLPSAAARLADPESFYAGLKTKQMELDSGERKQAVEIAVEAARPKDEGQGSGGWV